MPIYIFSLVYTGIFKIYLLLFYYYKTPIYCFLFLSIFLKALPAWCRDWQGTTCLAQRLLGHCLPGAETVGTLPAWCTDCQRHCLPGAETVGTLPAWCTDCQRHCLPGAETVRTFSFTKLVLLWPELAQQSSHLSPYKYNTW